MVRMDTGVMGIDDSFCSLFYVMTELKYDRICCYKKNNK